MLFVLLSLPVLAHGSEPRPVALYNAQRCTQPPVIDGDLQADACWKDLPLADHFYQYWKPVPTRPPLRTSFRACFDDTGLYLGITLEDEHMATLKADIKDRDNPETWTDDCVEIMVDPFNTGDSYTKFTVNANGARHDQIASHLELNDGWSSENWRAAVRKYADEWTIEVSLPWSDLGAKPRDGDVWSFDLVRYSFSTGAFRGVTWSLGGAGAAPQNFGYLGFGRFDVGRKADCDRLARAAKKTKGRSFQIHQSDGVHVRDEQASGCGTTRTSGRSSPRGRPAKLSTKRARRSPTCRRTKRVQRWRPSGRPCGSGCAKWSPRRRRSRPSARDSGAVRMRWPFCGRRPS